MMSAGHVQWRGCLSIHGNFEYIPGYWEWAEDILSHYSGILDGALLSDVVLASLCFYDCSDAFLKAFCDSWCRSTNTLIIPPGELSISLWELLELGGLPVTGHLFDEVVPIAECLSPTLDSDARLPRSCRFLLLSSHRLASHFLDSIVYEENVYCAAFLSCWLCVFVLPVEPLFFIRASVFKMASILAKGSRVSLAPPVLAYIYRSLSQISLSECTGEP
ncbi:hypothetical protein LIER_05423 [Lithospermum erythrorhizon]|uniref:Aminotransferase-like plant mobile domain-containing protein n=1 Tax=Lithospermum erythrorhizon TaxID=34254 RepID=A0AAV3P0S7_LITER